MPRPHEHRLIHVLLPLWISLLTLSQVGLFITFFTAQHHSQTQNNTGDATEHNMQRADDNKPSSSHAPGFVSEKSKMLTFVATKVNRSNKTIEWTASNSYPRVVSEKKDLLTIKQDGFYFLCLKVTLQSLQEKDHTVRLTWMGKVLLEARINKTALSTGFLGKVGELHASSTLMVTIDPPCDIDVSVVATYLDVIFLVKT